MSTTSTTAHEIELSPAQMEYLLNLQNDAQRAQAALGAALRAITLSLGEATVQDMTLIGNKLKFNTVTG